MLKDFGLRSRLMLLILLAFVPVVGLIVYNAYEQRQLQQAEARRAMSVLAREIAARHAQVIESTRHALLALSLMPAVRGANAAECSVLFAELLPRYPHYLNLVAATLDGNVFCSARPMAQPVNIAAEPSFTRALATREFALGEFSISKITGRPFIGQGFPVRNARGELVAVIGAILSVDWLNAEAARSRLPAGAALTVVDQPGNVVVRFPDAAQWVGKPLRDHTQANARERGEASVEGIGLDGVARVYGLATVGNVPPPAALHVSVGVSAEELFAPVDRALRRNLLLLAAAAGLALAIAWFGTGATVTRPLARLGAVTRRIAAGELDARAAMGGGAPEIRALTLSVNAMAATLQGDTAALREGVERLRVAVRASGVGLWDWDLQTNRVAFSAEWKRQLGYEEEEVADAFSEWESRLHPQDQPEANAYVQRYLADPKGAYEVEFRMRHKDGTYRWIYARGEVLKDVAGQPVRLLGCHMDITARKQAEEALRVSRARLEALTRRLLEVQETERRTLARELHDEVGGVLTAVKLNLQSLSGKRRGDLGEAALADGLALVDGTIQAVRSLSLDLRPAVLDDLGLIPALRWYCGRQAQRAGVAIDLALDAVDLKGAPQLESACFRIVQEAVTNALRHADARRVQVALRRGDDSFELEIADDGGGFDVAAARKRGLRGERGGLLGMEERTSLLGGRFEIDAAPGTGTRVRAQFALPEAGAS